MKPQQPPQNTGNKKPEPFEGSKNTPAANYPPQDETPLPARSSSDEYDILREIENMFRQEKQKSQAGTEQPASTTNRPTRLEEHSQRYEEKTQSPSERTIKVQKVDTSYTSSEHEITTFKRKKLDSETERRAKAFEQNLAKKEETLPLFNLNLRDKLRHPATLKDYIIISEILGKPKAFD